MKRVNGWLAAGCAFTAVTLVAAVASAWSWLGRQEQHQHQTYRHAVSRVEVTVVGGSATLRAGAADRVDVDRTLTWSYPRPRVEERWDGTVLKVNVGCSQWIRMPGCSVAYTLRVPAGVAVTARAEAGDLAVRDLAGELTLSVDSGELTGTGLRSSSVAATGRSGGLDLRFAAAPTTVRATTSAGDVRVAVPARDAYQVHATTPAGRAHVDVRQGPAEHGTIVARSGSGDVRVGYTD